MTIFQVLRSRASIIFFVNKFEHAYKKPTKLNKNSMICRIVILIDYFAVIVLFYMQGFL